MDALSESVVRELDHRVADGIAVTLLWNSETGQVTVAVEDVRTRESFELDVDGGDALAAFHHPFAYAAYSQQSPACQMSAAA